MPVSVELTRCVNSDGDCALLDIPGSGQLSCRGQAGNVTWGLLMALCCLVALFAPVKSYSVGEHTELRNLVALKSIVIPNFSKNIDCTAFVNNNAFLSLLGKFSRQSGSEFRGHSWIENESTTMFPKTRFRWISMFERPVKDSNPDNVRYVIGRSLPIVSYNELDAILRQFGEVAYALHVWPCPNISAQLPLSGLLSIDNQISSCPPEKQCREAQDNGKYGDDRICVPMDKRTYTASDVEKGDVVLKKASLALSGFGFFIHF